MIKVENLSKIYDDVTVVDNLSFHLEKGKVYGFLGPNGTAQLVALLLKKYNLIYLTLCI